jgi:radical SAM protein with 4Fe4S-binding SPASM domain
MLQIISKILRKAGIMKGYGGELSEDIYEAYYKSRSISEKKYLCHAPFNNMYFNSLGDIANCWLTFENPEKYSEERTLKEIWFGEKFTSLRNNIKNFDLDSQCKTCKYYLEHYNHVNVLARAYDNEYPITDFPSMMEFELTNTCNLECTMCTGLLSSSIRSNRENLPPLKNPYGKKFVNELKEFIPHLHEARFNGGEPFLIKMYAEIWENIFQLNPACKIVVATNGTILNSRIKNTLLKGNFHINLSIDSLNKEKYESIRLNSDLDKVLDNFLYFKTYCIENKRSLCIMINPMRNNWMEMPDFVNFCNTHNVPLWFNSIIYPENLSLTMLSHSELQHIYKALSIIKFDKFTHTESSIFKHNTSTYYNLIEIQINGWMGDAKKREAEKTDVSRNIVQADSKEYFIKRLDSYLSNTSKFDSDEKQIVYKRLGEMEEILSKAGFSTNFYPLLNKSPLEVVVQHLLEYNAEELVDKVRPFYITAA